MFFEKLVYFSCGFLFFAIKNHSMWEWFCSGVDFVSNSSRCRIHSAWSFEKCSLRFQNHKHLLFGCSKSSWFPCLPSRVIFLCLSFPLMMERLHSKSPFVVESFSVVGIICPKMTFSFLDSFVFGVRQKNKTKTTMISKDVCLFGENEADWIGNTFSPQNQFWCSALLCFFLSFESNIKTLNPNRWKKKLFQIKYNNK